MRMVETYFLWFVFYSILGWVYETILCSTLEKRFINRGFLNGPYCPIYGFGALIVILTLRSVENVVLLFLMAAVLTSTLEYITSWGMEKLFHARWWDYSHKKWNINGRVCLLGAVAFGVLSLLIMKVVHPFVFLYTQKVPEKVLRYGSFALFALLLSDSLYTILSFLNFDQKLKEFSAELAEFTDQALFRYAETLKEKISETELHEKIGGIYERFRSRMNSQERRMLRAFPAFRSMRYNKHLQEFRKVIKKLEVVKKIKDRNRN